MSVPQGVEELVGLGDLLGLDPAAQVVEQLRS